jgi:hypothetical protein
LDHTHNDSGRGDAEQKPNVLHGKPLNSGRYWVDGDGEQAATQECENDQRRDTNRRDQIEAALIDQQQIPKQITLDIGGDAPAAQSQDHQS